MDKDKSFSGEIFWIIDLACSDSWVSVAVVALI